MMAPDYDEKFSEFEKRVPEFDKKHLKAEDTLAETLFGSSVHDDKEKLVQPPQQSQELTFSDWSDDEAADNILNRPEEPQTKLFAAMTESWSCRVERRVGFNDTAPIPLTQKI